MFLGVYALLVLFLFFPHIIKRYATLFQSVVLPCHYTSVSTQSAMVKWIYKSYCRDRTRDSFSFPDSYEAGSAASHLDCSDNRRTVRTVASISGSSVTLSEYYKNRDVTIINTADLRIGEVQWGDSGVYFCQVTIADDIEGQNEASVELLVLGEIFLLSYCFFHHVVMQRISTTNRNV
uniref:Immunoglobulin-like domain-containing receptor 2 n=1 Tax=Xiphophorus maculatus TaxID=8083 RepID=A0A3B5R692_XIPMA